MLAIAFAACIATWSAHAQSQYPTRPIRLLVPFAPGGGVDVVARIVGKQVSEKLGQPILVESKPGGGGAIAVGELMRSEADGYTLLMTTSAHATLPRLNKLAWHPSNDFTPIASIYTYMFVIATNAQSKARFATKHDLTFPLLADADHAVAEKYGVWQKKSLYGRSFMGLARTTYLIGGEGKVLKRWDNVKVDGHAEAVLAAVDAMESGK